MSKQLSLEETAKSQEALKKLKKTVETSYFKANLDVGGM